MEPNNTTLQQKLNIKPGMDCILLNAPSSYQELFPFARPIQSINDLAETFDWLQVFYIDRSLLEKEIYVIKRRLSKSGQLWISWPKISSKVESDLNENIVRQIGLDAGLVDVKIAAINDIWSGLKFVFRLRDR